MKKIYNLSSDVGNTSVDLTKRLYKSVADVVHQLDDQRGRAVSVRDLFIHSANAQRVKLRDYCERLMLSDPVGFGRRGEELLWRKGFYDVVSTAKRIRQNSKWEALELAYIRCHLETGVGHYHHLILRLQAEFQLDLRGVVDFPLIIADTVPKRGVLSATSNSSGDEAGAGAVRAAELEWAALCVYRSLVYLGDMERYLCELSGAGAGSLSNSTRYYHQALGWRPEAGMPHNQLGTMANAHGDPLAATYHYIRCLCSSQWFEGAEVNLTQVVERCGGWVRGAGAGDSPPLHRLVRNFVSIAGAWFLDRPTNQPITQLCDDALSRLGQCLMEGRAAEEVSTTAPDGTAPPPPLTDDAVFQLALIPLMCLQRLQLKGMVQQSAGCTALCLAITSQLLAEAVVRIEAVLPPPQPPLPLLPPPTTNGKPASRRRRRRRPRNNSTESSDDENGVCYSSSSDESEEEGLVFDAHSDGESDLELMNNLSNGVQDVSGLGSRPPAADHHQISNGGAIGSAAITTSVLQEMAANTLLLQAIKVCCDWVSCDADMLRNCGSSSRLLLERLVCLLNYLLDIPAPVDINGVQIDRIPLPEDVSVRGLKLLEKAHGDIDWAYLRTTCLTPKQETQVRSCKLVSLGRMLATSGGLAVSFDPALPWFSIVETTHDDSTSTNSPAVVVPLPKQPALLRPQEDEGQQKGSKIMGELWLRARVSELENKTRRSARSDLPPYLVLDCDALTHHAPLVKQLVASRKFILLVPTVVVSALDEEKRLSGKARDTIRWLETQLRNGNRFLRAQRSNEHLALPLIKYPKKKDKEAWLYFQVVECCHYLANQNSGGRETNLVTLITGSSSLLSPGAHPGGFSPIGIAQSAGISVEHIETFHAKWKGGRTSNNIGNGKSHG